MKTTKQICKDNEVSWYDSHHTKWFSEKEIIELRSKLCENQVDDFDNNICCCYYCNIIKDFLDAPDLNSRSSDEDSLNTD